MITNIFHNYFVQSILWSTKHFMIVFNPVKFFKTVPKMRLATKNEKVETPTIPCCWGGCCVECKDAWELNGHISEHMEEYTKCKVDEVFQCKWYTCQCEIQTLEEFHRHVYYHGYHTSLLVQGKFECDMNPNVPKCSLSAENRSKIPDLPNDFSCGWIDCQRTFSSIIEFQDHIVQHASFDYEIQKTPDDERPKIRCNWEYCKKELENKYRLIEHIRKHSNKKYVACWQCGELFRTKTTLFDHCKRQPLNNSKVFFK